eukprot:scaffold619_cov403-Prasinococcus_capsulatus_cf.AAC.17
MRARRSSRKPPPAAAGGSRTLPFLTPSLHPGWCWLATAQRRVAPNPARRWRHEHLTCGTLPNSCAADTRAGYRRGAHPGGLGTGGRNKSTASGR